MSDLRPLDYFVSIGGCTETATCFIRLMNTDEKGVDLKVQAKPVTRADIPDSLIAAIQAEALNETATKWLQTHWHKDGRNVSASLPFAWLCDEAEKVNQDD